MNIIDNSVIMIENLILGIYNTSTPTIEQIEFASNKIFELLNLSNLHQKVVLRRVKSRYVISFGTGVILKNDYYHQSWFYAAKSKINLFYFKRYQNQLLKEGFTYNVLNTMDDVSSNVVDLLGNPQSKSKFIRRGLVVGEVQSGKTANYISIITKAADAGYKVIFLLTGMLNTLRSQTQERIDKGFLGFDTAKVLDNIPAKIGVGVADFSRRPLSMTTISKDFNKSFAQSQLVHLRSLKEPTIFVIKKNTSVLKNIRNWLSSTLTEEDFANLPMLMIDDEADQASVNTKDPELDPTTINRRIRKILNLFPKQNYVGFTATPFANVFIEPDTVDEMYKNDLFPKDFIYALDSPSNYVSPESMFNENGKNNFMLKEIQDVSAYLTLKHKKDVEIIDIPKSLKEAVILFLVSNTIRDLRGENNSHRSMLVNMSRFTRVQNEIAEIINNYVKGIQRKVDQYPYSRFKNKYFYNDIISIIKNNYQQILLNEFDINTIMNSFDKSIQPIQVTSVNMSNKAEVVLNYKNHIENGLRVIAIGGQILSRGLTLEGLTISYFYRNSKYYDTLMQMGRWFGYRTGYNDLCRVYMTDEAIEWYGYISEATDELKNEIIKMRESLLTPSDFGLKVMNHPGTLYITSPSKLRSTKDYMKTISISGEVIETPRLYLNEEIIKRNFESANNFIKQIMDYEVPLGFSNKKHPLYKNVDSKYIIDFLDKFVPHKSCLHFQPSQIVEHIKGALGNSLKYFDVVIAQGNSDKEYQIFNKLIKPVNRKYKIRDEKIIQISGQRNRLGDPRITKAGLTEEQVLYCENLQRQDNVRANKSKDAISEKTYTRYLKDRNPLLVIYIVELMNKSKDSEIQLDTSINEKLVLGASIAFPKFRDDDNNQYIMYKLNRQAAKEIFFDDDYDEVEE